MTPLWKTKEGDLIPIDKMEDTHLLNTIRVLRGFSPEGTTAKMPATRKLYWTKVLPEEALKRGLTTDDVWWLTS